MIQYLDHQQECGRCHACCVIPLIEELDKPAGVKCPHARDGRVGACSIYKSRPQPCRTFNCVWKSSPSMPEGFRPDRCGIMLWAKPEGRVEVHLMGGASWEGSALKDWIFSKVAKAKDYEWKVMSA